MQASDSATLDHVFVWTKPNGGALAEALDSLGLVETYRRRHVGQGTANRCYAFNNAFLELLWIEDEKEASAPAIAPCRFVERATRGNPFGIAWRGGLEVATWDYKPPYLPEGVAVKVCEDSRDIEQPFMFTFPGSKPPSELPQGRRGSLQSAGGYATLHLAALVSKSAHGVAARQMKRAGVVMELERGAEHALRLLMKRDSKSGHQDVELVLPLAVD